jgi:phospholipid/cholesterol/gamma-HCH transport system substrate-binding protein
VRRLVAVTTTAITTSVLLAGCGSGFHGVYNVPLPGGAALGSHPIQVSAQFTDVLDLVPQSGVKVNNVAVGRVTKISLEPDGKTADVTMEINGDVHLPANAVASVQQTSLLGEKYVALAAPVDQAATGALASGARIPDSSTTQGIQLEQVFGALSLLLNGGGVAQLQEVTTQLNKAASGHENDIRSFLTSADKVIAQLNTHRASITKALDGLDRLSRTLAANNSKISNVLTNFSPGLKVLVDQRTQLVAMLHALDQLSGVTVSTLNASQAEMIADLKQLQPILANLASAGTSLPQSLQVLLTYPFPDAGAFNAIRGDYLNAFITTNLRTPGGTTITPQSWPQAPSGASSSPSPTAIANGSSPNSIPPPPNLLPATSSVAAGLTVSSIDSGPNASTGTAGSASPTGTSGSTSPSGSASGSGSPSGSGGTSGSTSPSSSVSSAGSPPTSGGGH